MSTFGRTSVSRSSNMEKSAARISFQDGFEHRTVRHVGVGVDGADSVRAEHDLEIVAEVSGDGRRESMSDKYTQLSRASNPFIHGQDGWKFVPVQLAAARDPELVHSESGSIPVQERARKCVGNPGIPRPPKAALSDLVIFVQVVNPCLNLPDDLREFQHWLRRREINNNFLRLGRRIAHTNEIALEDLFPAFAASGSFGTAGLAGRAAPSRAIRRCGLVHHNAVPCLLLCQSLGLRANESVLVRAVARISGGHDTGYAAEILTSSFASAGDRPSRTRLRSKTLFQLSRRPDRFAPAVLPTGLLWCDAFVRAVFFVAITPSLFSTLSQVPDFAQREFNAAHSWANWSGFRRLHLTQI